VPNFHVLCSALQGFAKSNPYPPGICRGVASKLLRPLRRLSVDESRRSMQMPTSQSRYPTPSDPSLSADPYGEDYRRLQAPVKMTHFCYNGPGAGNGTDLRARWEAVAPYPPMH
jgi:hypothetical protein